MRFNEKLDKIIHKQNSLVCVGLDSDPDKIPQALKKQFKNYIFEFNKAIIDSTYDIVCSYKLNSAFYEACGKEGIEQLKMTCDYLIEYYPDIPIILDAKRADIPSTNEAYVKYAYTYLRADATTLNPYMGHKALEPFLREKDKGCIICCKTSNPGSNEIQNLLIEGEPLYKKLAKMVIDEWDKNKNCMLVIGATYPEDLAEIRKLSETMTFLIPGIGTQQGDLEKVLRAGLNGQKEGLIITASRSIIYASNESDYAQKARQETEKLKNKINSVREILVN